VREQRTPIYARNGRIAGNANEPAAGRHWRHTLCRILGWLSMVPVQAVAHGSLRKLLFHPLDKRIVQRNDLPEIRPIDKDLPHNQFTVLAIGRRQFLLRDCPHRRHAPVQQTQKQVSFQHEKELTNEKRFCLVG
ncbi:MAG: hypothetical protein ACTHK7_04925, partial [Aureliella sp.]